MNKKILLLAMALIMLLGSVGVFAYSVSNRQIYFTRYSDWTNFARYLNVYGNYSFSSDDINSDRDNAHVKIQVGNDPNYYYWNRPGTTVINGFTQSSDVWNKITAYELGEVYKTYEYFNAFKDEGTTFTLDFRAFIETSRLDDDYSWCRYWSGQMMEDERTIYFDYPVQVKRRPGDI